MAGNSEVEEEDEEEAVVVAEEEDGAVSMCCNGSDEGFPVVAILPTAPVLPTALPDGDLDIPPEEVVFEVVV